MKPLVFPKLPVLLVDDEEAFLRSASIILSSDGITHLVRCSDSRQVMTYLASGDFAVVALDLLMPPPSGKELLSMILQEKPELPVVILTAVDDVETAVTCIKEGAFDYLVKPIDAARLVTTLRRAIQFRQLQDENERLKEAVLSEALAHPQAFSEMVTQNRRMLSIFQYLEAVAPTGQPVLITGETGVGKERIARALHQLSGRTGEWVAVNVAGLDDGMFSDTLFGHQAGAFTGAMKVRKGLIEQACGGTLFLDEIGDLHVESQVKLLRLLQEGTYLPLGAERAKTSQARMVVATNREVLPLLESGSFRKDFYYRLRTHHIHLPPLRERRDDLPLLIHHFLEKAAHFLGVKKPTPPKELLTLLEAYPFPGNVRELEGMIFDAVSQHRGGVLSTASFREKIQPSPPQTLRPVEPREGQRLLFTDAFPTLAEAERLVIAEALARAGGNQTIAAQLLGLSRQALNKRLSRSQP